MAERGAATPKKANLWKRDELDWYVEPIRATEALLRRELFDGPVWDPAAGGGNIVRALLAAGYKAIGSDVVDRGSPAFVGHRDFLKSAEPTLAPNIVCNPPFFRAVGAEAFIRRALALAVGKVAMFVDVRFIAGSKRANGIFAELPPQCVYIITPRPSCPPGRYLAEGGVASNGTSDWCWLVWNRAEPTPVTQLEWLRWTPGAVAAC